MLPISSSGLTQDLFAPLPLKASSPQKYEKYNDSFRAHVSWLLHFHEEQSDFHSHDEYHRQSITLKQMHLIRNMTFF